MMAELRPAMLDLAKSSYAHFTLIKLLSLAPKRDIPGARTRPSRAPSTATVLTCQRVVWPPAACMPNWAGAAGDEPQQLRYGTDARMRMQISQVSEAAPAHQPRACLRSSSSTQLPCASCAQLHQAEPAARRRRCRNCPPSLP